MREAGTHRLHLQQPDAVGPQPLLDRRHQPASDAPCMQGGVDRDQVQLGRCGEVPFDQGHPDRPSGGIDGQATGLLGCRPHVVGRRLVDAEPVGQRRQQPSNPLGVVAPLDDHPRPTGAGAERLFGGRAEVVGHGCVGKFIGHLPTAARTPGIEPPVFPSREVFGPRRMSPTMRFGTG